MLTTINHLVGLNNKGRSWYPRCVIAQFSINDAQIMDIIFGGTDLLFIRKIIIYICNHKIFLFQGIKSDAVENNMSIQYQRIILFTYI